MKKPLFNKVCIVGVGLIGGSVGMAIKKQGLAETVVGVVRSNKTGQLAKEKKAIEDFTLNLREGIEGADLIILAAPVLTIIQHIKEIGRLKNILKDESIVIDVGSSKGFICAAADRYLKGIQFVGCHPMAGSEKSGIMNASADLFEKSACILSMHHDKVGKLWKAVGVFQIFPLPPEQHDLLVARYSHLPHVSAFAQSQKVDQATLLGINPSFRSVLRLAKSNPLVWSSIFVSNRKAIRSVLKEHLKSLQEFDKMLKRNDRAEIRNFLLKACKNAIYSLPNDK